MGTHQKMKKIEIDKNENNISALDLKRKLIEATDAVRKKFNYIKNRHVENKVALEKIYEPLTKPLKNISEATQDTNRKFHATQQYLAIPPKKFTTSSASTIETPKFEVDQAVTVSPRLIETPPSSITTTPSSPSMSSSGVEKLPYIVSNYIEGMRAGEPAYDTKYGMHVDINSGKLAMGNAEVRFHGKNITFLRNNKKLGMYKGNPQLYDLLFLKLPPALSSDGNGFSDENKKIFAEILNITNAAYKNYDVTSGFNQSKTKKYIEVIKPLLHRRMTTRSMKGSGIIPNKKIYTGENVDYIYWNKPKELIDRLKLLWSSKMAGHSGHENEILSIIDELREEGIIY